MTQEEEYTPLCPEEEELNRVGVLVHYHQNWVGEVGKDRHSEPDPNHITNVKLPFTPEEWWQLATRDGQDYMGGCCGTTGVMQDIINNAFRDSGWIDGDALLELGQLGETHKDGFEDWNRTLTGPKLRKALATWPKLSVWDRIGVIYRVLKNRLHSGRSRKQEIRYDQVMDEKHVINTLRNGLTLLSYRDLFSRNDKDTGEKVQDHSNRLLHLARIIPAARFLLQTISEYEPFEGVAVVWSEEPEIVFSNGFGFCIYHDASEAQKIIDLSSKDDLLNVRLRPVRITLETGLEFLDVA